MHQNFINGRLQKQTGTDSIAVINPSNDKAISEIPESRLGDVDNAVEAALKAQQEWARMPALTRAGYLRRLASRIRARADKIAYALSEEQGKVQSLAQIEASFTADYLEYTAEWARRIEGEIIPSDRADENIFLFRRPIGVVGGILPWNFPFFLIARKMAPALLTGNTIVIKPSELTPNNAALFVEAVLEADLPPGVFNLVYGHGTTVGNRIAGHPDVGMVTFTGSVATGKAIMKTAAENVTKVNLELGGKAPAIVAADANIDLAVKSIKASRVINSGQVCNCAERIYVDRIVADEFVDKFVAAMASTTYGDPLADIKVDMGPLITGSAQKRVKGMVDRAVMAGAEVLTGGNPDPQNGGYFFEPTVLVNCRHDMEIMQQEIFGPVSPINVVEDIEEAIFKANDSIYGLTSSIYTSNTDTALRAYNEIQFGETYVNRENFEAMQGFHAGSRRSGIGGADGKHGILEFTESHVVYHRRTPSPTKPNVHESTNT